MNRIVITLEKPHIQTTQNKLYAKRRRNEYQRFKENCVCKEVLITIANKLKLDKWQGRNLKNRRIINTYLNKQHHGFKRTNLCMNEISFKNWCSPKGYKQKLKTWIGNSTGKVDKKYTTTSENDKTEGERWNMRQKKAMQVKQTIQLEEIKLKVLTKDRRLKRYWNRIKQYKQDIPKQRKKGYQLVGVECRKTYQQPDDKETKQF